MSRNPISSSVDFNRNGVQHGHLKLPHSRDDSAWGAVMIPITVVKNGDGPTAVLTGANHGDEYEGPVALFDLAARLDPTDMCGRVIIVPAFNYPAFLAKKRTSPIDDGNLNRAFPGAPDGTVTQKIADYFQTEILPLADLVVDIHSGGKTLEFASFAAAHVLADKTQQAACVAAMTAFNAPYSLMLVELDAVGMYDTAAEDMGKIFISTELGGGGTATAETAAIAKRGIANVLKHVGILTGTPEIGPTVHLEMPDERCFITCDTIGLIEYTVSLGETVQAGQVIAHVYDIHRTGGAPTQYRSAMTGIFMGRHFPGLIGMGDVVAMLAVEVA